MWSRGRCSYCERLWFGSLDDGWGRASLREAVRGDATRQ